MPSFTCTLERKITKRINPETLKEQIEHVADRGTAGIRKAWSYSRFKLAEPEKAGELLLYKIDMKFERGGNSVTADVLNKEIAAVLEYMQSTGLSSKYKPYPWAVTNIVPSWKHAAVPILVSPEVVAAEETKVVGDIVNFEKALTIEEIEIPDVLVHGSDAEIENHSAFTGIFGRAGHIRLIASAIKRMKDTKGQKRNHILLWGLPGCAKSHILMGWMKVLGVGGYVTVNANSVTRAGVERIFLDRLKETGCPPIFFAEEVEKSIESISNVWLSIMDDRAEVRKVTYHRQERAETPVLMVATANDKVLLDRLHGGRPGYPGALSSRFTKKLYVPRPDVEIMKRILLRDIELYGGDIAWVEPCLDIAGELKTNDPRIVLSLLDGQDRLLDGSYKEDILNIHNMETKDMWVGDETSQLKGTE